MKRFLLLKPTLLLTGKILRKIRINQRFLKAIYIIHFTSVRPLRHFLKFSLAWHHHTFFIVAQQFNCTVPYEKHSIIKKHWRLPASVSAPSLHEIIQKTHFISDNHMYADYYPIEHRSLQIVRYMYICWCTLCKIVVDHSTYNFPVFVIQRPPLFVHSSTRLNTQLRLLRTSYPNTCLNNYQTSFLTLFNYYTSWEHMLNVILIKTIEVIISNAFWKTFDNCCVNWDDMEILCEK